MDGRLRNMATVYIRKGNEILMLYRIGSKVVDACWCGIGGHFKNRELNDARTAVLREMKEEIRLCEKDLYNLRLRYVALRQVKEELRINYYFFADISHTAKLTMKCNEGVLKWISIDELQNKNMPITAKYCLEHYLNEGVNTDCVYAVIIQNNKADILPIGNS